MTQAYEDKIADSLQQGICDPSVVDLLAPRGLIHSYETEFWDYKLGFIEFPPHKNDVDKIKSELIKDIVCFHNTYGGYILFGYPNIFTTNTFQFLQDSDHLRDVIRAHSNADVRIKLCLCKHKIGVNEEDVLLIFCPKRHEPSPAYFTKSAPTVDNKQAFKKGEVWFRDGHRNELLTNKPEKISFIAGNRDLDLRVLPIHAVQTLHNLPPRDPNLLRFIGRQEYLSQLWAWENDRRDPIRVLSAIGGTGKTAIAYEFCEKLLSSTATRYDKIIWLTAKSQTFAAVLMNYVSTTRTDFIDTPSLVDALLLELACSENELSEYESNEKEDLLEIMLSDLNVFVVIDDVDSLIADQQSELYALVSRLFYKANARGALSRILLTSRLELAAGAAQLIHVKGFDRDEAKDYYLVTAKHLNMSAGEMADVDRSFDALYEASKGSPIFIASILKIITTGDTVAKAVTSWEGKSGEEVRRFAFKREIEALSYAAQRILFAMQVLSTTSIDELCEIVDEDKFSVQEHLAKLRQYQLFAGASDAAKGMVISVPEPIRLMIGITEQKLEAKDANSIKSACAKAKRANRASSDIGRRIARVSILWKQKRMDEARLACELAIREFPKVGDLNCLLGRTLLSEELNDPRKADAAFKEANFKKCERPELGDFWAEAKFKLRDWRGLIAVTNPDNAYPVRGRPTAMRIGAMYFLGREAEDRGDLARAAAFFAELCEDGLAIIRAGRAESATEMVERLLSHGATAHIDVLSRMQNTPEQQLKALELITKYSGDHIRLLSPTFRLIDELTDVRENVAKLRGAKFVRSNLIAIHDAADVVAKELSRTSNNTTYALPVIRLVRKIEDIENL